MAQGNFEIVGTVKLLLRPVDDAPPQAGCFVTLTLGPFTVTARGDAMAYTLPADKQVQVKVRYIDAAGNPATVDGEVAWGSSNDAIALVLVDETDSFQAVVRPGGQVGQAQINATVDADLGEGVRQLITLMDVEIVSGEAVAGVIEPVGEPTSKPQPK